MCVDTPPSAGNDNSTLRTPPSWAPPRFCADRIVQTPFHYANFEKCWPDVIGEAILEWFEDAAPWHLTCTDFYEQSEFSCWDSLSPVATFLRSDDVLHAVRATMTHLFAKTFEESVNVVCHRLLPPQKIGIHNDALVGEETHRMLIQFNRGLKDADGGVLMLFNSDDPSDIHRLLRPVHLSGFAFEISTTSNHAVSQIHGGERYSLIYSFRATAE
jgi:hypothetical protein